MKDINLAEKCEQLRQKNYNTVLQDNINLYNNVLKTVYAGENLSEEELDQKINDEIQRDMEGIEKCIDSVFDPNKICDHTVIINNINIFDLCADLRGQEKEIFRILMFDKDLNYLGYCQKEGAATSISKDVIKEVINDVINNHPLCKNIISVHNHPLLACATPSLNDGLWALVERMRMKKAEIEMIDDCVISELDFYSRKQQETSNADIETAVLSLELDDDSITKLKGVNRNVDLYYRQIGNGNDLSQVLI